MTPELSNKPFSNPELPGDRAKGGSLAVGLLRRLPDANGRGSAPVTRQKGDGSHETDQQASKGDYSMDRTEGNLVSITSRGRQRRSRAKCVVCRWTHRIADCS